MTRRLQRAIHGGLVSLFCLASAPVWALTVVNGGFETGNFSGWTQFGNVDATGVDRLAPHAGTYAAYFGPSSLPAAGQASGGPGGISQALTTVAGANYTVDFWLKNEGGPGNAFSVSWSGRQIDASSLTDAPAFAYRHYRFSQTATASTTALTFSFRQDPAFWNLDQVSVVPEPTSQALMAGGLLALLAARHSRRAQRPPPGPMR